MNTVIPKPATQRFRQPISLGDKFYMALHDVAQTMIYLVDVQVRGTLSEDTIRGACVATFRRFPILKSVVRGKEGWFGRLYWDEIEGDGEGLHEYIDYYQDGKISPDESARLYREAYVRYSNTRWNIREEPPIKIKLIRRGEHLWSIFFLTHHAVADGIAITAILEVFAENYALLSQNMEPPLTPIPQATRGYLKFFLRTPPWKLITTLWAYLRYERMNRPRPNTPFLVDWIQRHGTLHAVDLVIHGTLTRRLVERVRDLGITLNEAMILACARSLSKWIKGQGREPKKISISVPVNIRPYLKLSPRESVSNCSVAMNMNFRASLVERAAELIEALRFQSHCMKRLRFPLIGIIQAALISWLPLRLLKKMMVKSIESGQAARSTATIVYSNVGMVFLDEKGDPFLIPLGKDGVLESVRFSNPVAYPVAASMGTVTYGGKIKVSLSYLEPVLTRETVQGFLRDFQQELFSVMDEKHLMRKPLPPFSETVEHLGNEQVEWETTQPTGDAV